MSDEPKSQRANRRSSVRLPFCAIVKVECRKGSMGLGPNIAVYTVNLSENGLRLVLKVDLPRGQEVEVIMQGQDKPIKRMANVMWSQALPNGTFDVGLDFQSNLSFSEYQSFIQRTLK
jgi:hypothetical protein